MKVLPDLPTLVCHCVSLRLYSTYSKLFCKRMTNLSPMSQPQQPHDPKILEVQVKLETQESHEFRTFVFSHTSGNIAIHVVLQQRQRSIISLSAARYPERKLLEKRRTEQTPSPLLAPPTHHSSPRAFTSLRKDRSGSATQADLELDMSIESLSFSFV